MLSPKEKSISEKKEIYFLGFIEKENVKDLFIILFI